MSQTWARLGGAPVTDPAPLHVALDEAIRDHRAGSAEAAAARYRQVLLADPSHPDALHLLGVLALQAGRAEEAEALVRRSLAVRPRSLSPSTRSGW